MEPVIRIEDKTVMGLLGEPDDMWLGTTAFQPQALSYLDSQKEEILLYAKNKPAPSQRVLAACVSIGWLPATGPCNKDKDDLSKNRFRVGPPFEPHMAVHPLPDVLRPGEYHRVAGTDYKVTPVPGSCQGRITIKVEDKAVMGLLGKLCRKAAILPRPFLMVQGEDIGEMAEAVAAHTTGGI